MQQARAVCRPLSAPRRERHTARACYIDPRDYVVFAAYAGRERSVFRALYAACLIQHREPVRARTRLPNGDRSRARPADLTAGGEGCSREKYFLVLIARRDKTCSAGAADERRFLQVSFLTSPGRRVYLSAGGQFAPELNAGWSGGDGVGPTALAAAMVRGGGTRHRDAMVLSHADGLQFYLQRKVGPQRAVVRGAPRSVGRPRSVPLAPLAPAAAGWWSERPSGAPAGSAAPPAAAAVTCQCDPLARIRRIWRNTLARDFGPGIINVLRAVFRVG
jgi:hypothetical protein